MLLLGKDVQIFRVFENKSFHRLSSCFISSVTFICVIEIVQTSHVFTVDHLEPSLQRHVLTGTLLERACLVVFDTLIKMSFEYRRYRLTVSCCSKTCCQNWVSLRDKCNSLPFAVGNCLIVLII